MIGRATFRAVRELGFDPRRTRLFAQLPRFWRDLRTWRRLGGSVSSLYPILADRSAQAGDVANTYFLQDLLVARRIYAARPTRHIDVGSRIDGFVAHLAVFRPVEVIDIRPLAPVDSNIRFLRADLTAPVPLPGETTDSLSCLHALEHFGLGRYGDPIDPSGHLRGFKALIGLLSPGGSLYLSVPIGSRPAVEFNAHRIFGPLDIFSWPASEELQLRAFDFIDDTGKLHEHVATGEIASRCRALVHGCGIYTFVKTDRGT